jgi:diguanylate cyclase (GGDEF)-like protein/PAS domain S-box-containing protein
MAVIRIDGSRGGFEMKFTKDFYEKLIDGLHEGMYFVDRERTILLWNKAAERITGFAAHEVEGTRCMDNILNHVDEHGTPLCIGDCPLSRSIQTGEVQEELVYLQHKDGHRVPVHTRVTPIEDDEGNITGAVETFMDTTVQVATLEQINKLREIALLDPLTRVGNRRFIETAMQARLDEMRRFGWRFGLLFIDLDHFKAINDQYGHEAGDEMLKHTTSTISNALRTFDLIGRWGGEEFAALIVQVHEKELERTAERIRMLMESSCLHRNAEPIRTTVSIGATIANPDDTVSSLMRRADELMYQSKKAGRNRVTIDTQVKGASHQMGQ